MSRSLGVEVGTGRSGDSAQLTGSRTRVLRLSGQQVHSRLDGVFAIVEADVAEIDRIYAFLESAFTVAILPGTEEDYVARLLAPLERSGASVVLALWLSREVVIGACHDGHAYLYRAHEFVYTAVESHGGVRITRVTPTVDDSLVLVGAGVARHVTKSELAETVRVGFRSGYSVRDAATWLAALASARGGHDASALVLHFQAGHKAGKAGGKPVSALRRTALLRRVGTGIVALGLCLVMLGAVFLVWRPSSTSSKTPLAGSPANHPTIAPSVTHRRSAAPTPVLTTPRAVHVKPAATRVPALPHASGTVLIALYNPEAVPVVTEVRIRGTKGIDSRQVRIPPKSTVKLQLPAQRGVPALTVQVRRPIVPARLIVG